MGAHGGNFGNPLVALSSAQLGDELDSVQPRQRSRNDFGIGELLFLSAKTIHNIHYQIKKKLQVSNDIELTKLAIAWGLTSPSITQ